jgi:hypothetical protein
MKIQRNREKDIVMNLMIIDLMIVNKSNRWKSKGMVKNALVALSSYCLIYYLF